MKDVLGHRGQNAQGKKRCDELLRRFKYIRKHRRDRDRDENANREAVICQQRSQNNAPQNATHDLTTRPSGRVSYSYSLVLWELGKLLPTPSVR